MKTSVRWLNRYVSPAGISAGEAERLLTAAGFPIETTEALADGDSLLDVEVTSNRGDCLSHIGLAREIAAATGRALVYPAIGAGVPAGDDPAGVEAAAKPGGIGEYVSLTNQTPDVCRLFTARLVRGVKVGPSPAWMVEALAAVGQRSINNVVDITNYVLFEFGQPTHVFDLNQLKGAGAGGGGSEGRRSVIVRYAHAGEGLTLLDGKRIELRANELVVADGPQTGGAVSLAGIMGGLGTEVTERTTDVLLEAATWDPATIRRAARRLGLRTDASHRFERVVDPRTIDRAARRAAALLVELGGPAARLVPGVLRAGPAAAKLTRVSMRLARCREMLGFDVGADDVTKALRGHEIEVGGGRAGVMECTIPAHRPDLDREIDLIEEVARTVGLESVPIHEKVAVRVAEPQISERAARELARTLTALGFYETVTFSFVSPRDAGPFCPKGMSLINLCDERRKADPTLRPSALPSLLACRRANQDGGVSAPGGVRLFEVASVFAQEEGPGGARSLEREARVLALVADAAPTPIAASGKAVDLKQATVRLVRGALESVARALGGEDATIELVPTALPVGAFDPSASAEVRLVTGGAGAAGGRSSRRLGLMGVISNEVQRRYDLPHAVVGAEVDVNALISLFPPRSLVRALPAFPGIERDLSLIVAEAVAWGSIDRLIGEAALDMLVGREFVTTFRGTQIGAGKKSVTVRLAFRDPARTLRHEEVDPQVAVLVRLAGERLGATLRV